MAVVLSDTPWILPEMKEVVEVVFGCTRRITECSPAEDQRSDEPPKPAQSSLARVIVGGVDHAVEELCAEPPGEDPIGEDLVSDDPHFGVPVDKA